MTTSPANPHDRFFKETFGRPQMTRDFLRSYLPADVVALLDLDTLELEKEPSSTKTCASTPQTSSAA